MWSSSIRQTVDSGRSTVGTKANCGIGIVKEGGLLDVVVKFCKADLAKSELSAKHMGPDCYPKVVCQTSRP